jgi:hypothetical protein
MKEEVKYYPVNWIDGMKINKDHFIAQENAFSSALHNFLSPNLSPIRYGIVRSDASGRGSFNVKVSADNQNAIRVNVLSCQAITPGGVWLGVPGSAALQRCTGEGENAVTLPFLATEGENTYWVLLTVNPYDRIPFGAPDPSEMPPRFPYIIASCTVLVVSNSQYLQFAYHPYAIVIGKLTLNGNEIRVDESYIPPCYTVSAHPDLLAFLGETDQFLSNMERRCTQIVQKILKKNQQNNLSQLVSFLCDRLMLFIGPNITELRYTAAHEAPVKLLTPILSIARIMKNTIDFHLGSGKEELMNYLSEWCDMNQSDLENMLNGLSIFQYDHNNIGTSVQAIRKFMFVTSQLFDTLSNLEFIGKRRDTGIFIKEENKENTVASEEPKPRRKFFG